MFYVSPNLNKKASHKIHLNQNSFNKVYKNKVQQKMDKLKFLYGLKAIEKEMIKSKNKSLLDVGCGMGISRSCTKKLGCRRKRE